MSYLAILTIIAAFLSYGLISGRIRTTILTGPMLFAAFGMLIGPAAINIIPLEIDNATFHILAEVTLILVLFADAANIDLKQLRRDHNLPLRMLLIGMPLSIVLTALVAMALLSNLSIWEALLLAAILAPTDAALGQAVVTNPIVPIRIRQALNVESGLNDGIALPFVLIFAVLESAADESGDATQWLLFGLQQVTLGPIGGILVGYVGAKVVALCYQRGWMTESAEGIVALALAFGSFAFAELILGNGFIAAFVAGLTFGNTLGQKCRFLYEFAEAEGQILILLTFMALGSVMSPIALSNAGGAYIVFALLALTAVRIVPISLSLLGSGVRPVTWVFLGWFGPRGLASVLFVLLILEEAEIAHKEEIFTASILTVALSILLHGISAVPAARRYGEHAQAMGDCEENQPVSQEPFSGSAR